jgi:hypothetical protein
LAPLLGFGFCSFSSRHPVLFFAAANHTIDNDVSRHVERNRDFSVVCNGASGGRVKQTGHNHRGNQHPNRSTGHLEPTNDSFVTVIRSSFRATF